MDAPSASAERRAAEPALPAPHGRLRLIGLSIWPLLIAFWLLGLGWLGMSSLACWGGHVSPGWRLACDWVFALPLLPGLLVVAAFALALLDVRRAGRRSGREAPGLSDTIRFGYRVADDDDRVRVRRALFGTLTVIGWTLAALAFSYLQLMLWAVAIGVAVMAAVLLVNRYLLQAIAQPRYRFGVMVPPHERGPVAWYNPSVLLPLARNWLSSFDMLRNADARDAFVDRLCVTDLAGAAPGELWFDFIADTGDSGNAAYTVARAALADELLEMPRGRLLVLGGDLAYPGAGAQEYQSHFLELFEGARPRSGLERHAHTVLAIPQNHDWFDSLATFKRYFVNRNLGEFIGADTPQKASYFAARLPQGWWILGLDFALAGDIDRGQLEGFRALLPQDGVPPYQPPRCDGDGPPLPGPRMRPGDQVILVYPEPFWTRPLGDGAQAAYPRRYQRLEAELDAAGCTVRLRLAGDQHHYVREIHDTAIEGRSALVTCGCGGAFLHPTHAASVSAPRRFELLQDEAAIDPEFRRSMRVGTVEPPTGEPAPDRRVYPDPAITRALSWGNLLGLFMFGTGQRLGQAFWTSNIPFVVCIGALYWLAHYTNSLLFSASFGADHFVASDQVHTLSYASLLYDWFRALFYSPPAFGVYVVLLLLCVSLAKDEDSWVVRLLFPFLHFLLHVAAAAWLYLVAADWVDAGWRLTMQDRCEDACKAIVTASARGLFVFVGGAVVGGLITGTYLALMARAGWLPNNAFSPLANEDYKGFMRFKVAPDGTLEAYFLACDRVPRRWRPGAAKPGQPAGSARPAWTEAGSERAAWHVADCFKLHRHDADAP